MSVDIRSEPATPVEVLIPEARRRQRRRYVRTGLCAALGALVVAGLTVAAVLFIRGPAASQRSRFVSAQPAALDASVPVVIRPVLCLAAPYSAAPGGLSTTLPTTCAAPYAVTPAALAVAPSGTGYWASDPVPDPAFATYRNTSTDSAGSVVLLGGTPRYLLGPAAMKLSPPEVQSVTVRRSGIGAWVVSIRFTATGSRRWDAVGRTYFHSFLAIDLRGRVVSAPLIEPTNSSFSSFEGRMDITGGHLSKHEAVALATALKVRH
jgi:hypothetical protein